MPMDFLDRSSGSSSSTTTSEATIFPFLRAPSSSFCSRFLSLHQGQAALGALRAVASERARTEQLSLPLMR